MEAIWTYTSIVIAFAIAWKIASYFKFETPGYHEHKRRSRIG